MQLRLTVWHILRLSNNYKHLEYLETYIKMSREESNRSLEPMIQRNHYEGFISEISYDIS